MQVAVIGLGSMGFGMAASLARAGFEVTGFDVRSESVARFSAEHGKGAASPAGREIGRHSREYRSQAGAGHNDSFRLGSDPTP